LITFNVYHIAHNSHIYGPGSRDVIWFKGCSIHCKDCINQHLWPFSVENEVSLEELVGKLETNEITLLGGEPLDQMHIPKFVDELKKRNFGIVLFTGYSLKTLKGTKLEAANMCDVVISEPFDINKKDDSLYLRGSSNQVITFNSDRYKDHEFVEKSEYELIISDDLEFRGRKNIDFIEDLLK